MEVSKTDFFDEVLYKNSEKHQFIEMLAYSALGFFIPFAVGHPQLLVGVLVNAFLIKSALTLPGNKILPVVIAPSLGALAQGMVFGPFTIYLALMAPFIWIGNLILVYAFKAGIRHNMSYALTLIGGSIAKAGVIYLIAFALYSASFIPEALLSAMGIMQFATAVVGGMLAYPLVKSK